METLTIEMPKTIDEVISETTELANRMLKTEQLKGVVKYGNKTYDLDEWVTLSQYAKIHGLKMNTISNWLSRGNISVSDKIVIPQLNNLVLIQNKKY